MKYLQIRSAIIILILVSLGIFIWSYLLTQKKSEALTTENKEIRTAVVVSKAPTATPRPSPTPAPLVRPSPNKNAYVIAAYGDSMIDTMGENMDYLDKQMSARYPSTKFKFYNYGIGSQNVKEGSARFTQSFNYQTRKYPPITEIKPDILIVSSFAYNPLYPYDKTAYLNALKELLDKSKATGAKVYLLAEIAPLKEGFGKGVGGVNWDYDKTKEQVGLILQNLNGAVSLASQTQTPLINAYESSKIDGKYGNKLYVGNHDGIHPSVEGEIFMASQIAETIKLP